jgi:hypothetical protein
MFLESQEEVAENNECINGQKNTIQPVIQTINEKLDDAGKCNEDSESSRIAADAFFGFGEFHDLGVLGFIDKIINGLSKS